MILNQPKDKFCEPRHSLGKTGGCYTYNGVVCVFHQKPAFVLMATPCI